MTKSHNNCFESDGLPFRCASGQAAAQAERYAQVNYSRTIQLIKKEVFNDIVRKYTS